MPEVPAIPQSLTEPVQSNEAKVVAGFDASPQQQGRVSPATSLYETTVPTFLQTVIAVRGFLDVAVAHCKETGADPDDLVDMRLFPNMAPLLFQIECVANHSVCGMEAMRTGTFSSPDLLDAPVPFATLRDMIARTEASLKAYTPEEVNSWSGKELVLHFGGRALPFTSETYFLSFALPNFYFHAVTAYNILRSRGVPLGKADFEGVLRLREI